jgi:hypothetical protein
MKGGRIKDSDRKEIEDLLIENDLLIKSDENLNDAIKVAKDIPDDMSYEQFNQ